MLTIIGTSQYLAPEILLGGGYDERVDLWSIGVTLYSLVAGETPFFSEYHSETINKIMKGVYAFDPEIWGGYSYFVKDLVGRLLKPRGERLTIKEASRHLWFGGDGKTPLSPLDKQRRGSQ
jgi:serine/threonine protein kinase